MPEEREQITALFRGIEQNRSIRHLSIAVPPPPRNMGLALGLGLGLGPMQSRQVREAADLLLSSLNAMIRSKSCCLTSLELRIDVLFGIPLRDDVAAALADVLKANKSLKHLSLRSYSNLSSEQITVLFTGIVQNRSITELCIYVDRLGESVLSSLSALLQSESCSLTSLDLRSNIFSGPLGDDGAVALADALKGNKSLKYLYFSSDSNNLTSVGWSAFSRLLCDTSSVSNTYLSNHSLVKISTGNIFFRHDIPQDLTQLLSLNKRAGKHADKDVAIWKILKYHPDFFDIGPFLGDEGKLLPLVMSWFERVSRQQAERSESARFRVILEEIQKRQLSTMYKIVRSMPGAVDGYRSYSSHEKTKSSRLERVIGVIVV
jgi:hypothetical protein